MRGGREGGREGGIIRQEANGTKLASERGRRKVDDDDTLEHLREREREREEISRVALSPIKQMPTHSQTDALNLTLTMMTS